jgi:hypothetical protein
VRSSHSAVSSRVSVPCVRTTPSAPLLAALRAAAPIASQSAETSCELSTASTSTTSTSRPAVSSAPLRAGRRTPSASVLVAIVPPVVMTVRWLMLGIIPHTRVGDYAGRAAARGGAAPCGPAR